MDDDTVEPHNLPNQFFPTEAVGILKVEALAIQMLQFNPEVAVETITEKFTDDFRWEKPVSREIVIVTTDTLKSRACIWGRCKNKPHIELFLDARMAAEQFEVHIVRPCNADEIKQYEATLYQVITSDSGRGRRALRKPIDLSCTSRAIAYNTFVIAGFIAHEIKRFVMNESSSGKELRGDLHEYALVNI